MTQRLGYLLVAPLLAAWLGACSGVGGSVPPAATPVIVRDIADLPPELKEVADNFDFIQSFRADLTVESTGFPVQKGILEFEAPDSVRLARTSGEAGYQSAMIAIGAEYFLKIGQSWFPRPIETPTPVPGATPTAFEQPIEILKGGTDRVNGKECNIYTLLASPGIQGELSTSTTVQVCIAEGRIQRAIVKAIGTTMTAVVDYDAKIDIQPPE